MAASAFYRKWRSQRFADLVGQAAVSQTLRNAVKSKRIAHAYLFCGPRGVGKTSAARILAKAINCPNAVDGEPCAICETCRSIQDNRQLDVIELDAASNNSVDDIRDIREKVGLAPAMLGYKFYILDEAHMLSISAVNALLKTLEEPPPHTVFVMVTTDAQRLPETIVSRCQRLDFRRIGVADAVGRLTYVCEQEGLHPEDGVLEILARSASGSLRDAEGSLDQLVAYAGSSPTVAATRSLLGAAGPEAAVDLIRFVTGDQVADAIRLINDLVDQGSDPRQVALDVVECLRSILLLRTSDTLANLIESGPETIPALRVLAEKLTPSAIVAMIRAFSPGPTVRGGLRPQLPLEMSVIEAFQALHAPHLDHTAAIATPIPTPVAPIVPLSRGPNPPPVPRAVRPTLPPAPSDETVTRAASAGTRPTPVNDPVDRPPQTAEIRPSPSVLAPAGGILFEEASRRWNEILDACGAKNRSVQALLRAARPVGLDSDGVVLGFTYEFHRERIEDPKNRIVVEEVMKLVLGQSIKIRCVVSTHETANATSTDPAQAVLDEPLVKAAVAMGARIRTVTDDRKEEKP